MRDVEIVTAKTQYKAGDTVEGHVIVRCDDDFNHNGIRITFKGREHTRIVISTGKTTHVHTDEHVYFDETTYLEEAGTMPIGEKRLPFSFQFPDDFEIIQDSFSGKYGWIEYTLEAVVEISRALDPKEKDVLEFRRLIEKPAPQSQREFAEKDGVPVLDVETDGDAFCLGQSIPLRFRVAHDVKIREVRVELVSNEFAQAGRFKQKARTTLSKQAFDDDEVTRGTWMDAQLPTDSSMQTTFSRPILSNEVRLKVTLNIPWSRDKIVSIPITLSHCSEQIMSEPEDIFNF